MITITAFKWVPPFARGLVRDLRVRWALEEAGLPYRARLIGPDDQKSADYRAWQPFGQVPAYEEDGLVLFESGAIVLHIGARSEALLPADEAGRARAVTWLLAALNSIEVKIQQLVEIDLFNADQEWAKVRRPVVEQAVQRRLADLAARLGERAYLDDRLTSCDLLLSSVLSMMQNTAMPEAASHFKSNHDRSEARPAFQRALHDQMAAFEER